MFYFCTKIVNIIFIVLIKISAKAVNSIFKNPESVFIKIKPMDFLFNGIIIDCTTVTDTAGKTVCSIMKKLDDLTEIEPDKFSFSLFGGVIILNFNYGLDKTKVSKIIKLLYFLYSTLVYFFSFFDFLLPFSVNTH